MLLLCNAENTYAEKKHKNITYRAPEALALTVEDSSIREILSQVGPIGKK